MASTESTHIVQTCLGIDDFSQQNDIAALKVLIEYLTGLEGPFWKKIRGSGLSYGYTIYPSIEEGLIYFILSKSASPVSAYHEAKSIIDSYLKKEIDFDQTSLDSAKSAVTYEIISHEETMHSACEVRFLNYLKKVSDDNNQKLIEKISNVTIEDLNLVLKKYLEKLFDKKTNLVIVTNTSKVKELKKDFKSENGIDLVVGDIDKFFK